MDAIEVINHLKELSGPHFFEVYEKTTFQCCREKKGGAVAADGGCNVQTVTVDIFDSGLEGEYRYHCIATGDDGAEATGNPGSTIKIVLMTVHWHKLDG
jgi:hypothetical protein